MLRLTISEKIFLIGHTSLIISLYILGRQLRMYVMQDTEDDGEELTIGKSIWMTIALLHGTIAAVCFDIYSREPSETHSMITLRKQYFSVLKVLTLGRWGHYKLQRLSTHVARAQQNCLGNILSWAKTTKYSTDKKLNDTRNVEDFIEKHSLTKANDYQEYVNEMMEYDVSDIMLPDKPIYFGVAGNKSSKTYFPFHSRSYRTWRRGFYKLHYAASKQFSCFKGLKKHVHIYLPPHLEYSTVDSTRIGNVTGLIGPSPGSTTPLIAYDLATDVNTLIYLHLIFGLSDRNVGRLLVKSPGTLRSFLNVFKQRWRDICFDIETGSLHINELSSEAKKQLENGLHANPARAVELRNFLLGDLTSIFPRIWPTLQVIQIQGSGPLEQETEHIRKEYCGHVPMYSYMYGCSAAPVCGLNCLWTANTSYVPTLDRVFFEFMPVESVHLKESSTLLLHEVNEGEMYELIVTTDGGLYRYRTGEIVKVVGFFHQLPLFDINGRVT
ncbi:uncharacterized protein LOC141915473 [Tubulanus polymorphus]|uniref:uncharacterized protein LOC141915473 n=1 Tax=Tubulanus polymorphus TaxID=672921 RepID=UPI003DA2A1FC